MWVIKREVFLGASFQGDGTIHTALVLRRQTNEGESGQKSNTTPSEMWTNTISPCFWHISTAVLWLSRGFNLPKTETNWEKSQSHCVLNILDSPVCLKSKIIISTLGQCANKKLWAEKSLFVRWVSSCWALTSPPKHTTAWGSVKSKPDVASFHDFYDRLLVM